MKMYDFFDGIIIMKYELFNECYDEFYYMNEKY